MTSQKLERAIECAACRESNGDSLNFEERSELVELFNQENPREVPVSEDVQEQYREIVFQ